MITPAKVNGNLISLEFDSQCNMIKHTGKKDKKRNGKSRASPQSFYKEIELHKRVKDGVFFKIMLLNATFGFWMLFQTYIYIYKTHCKKMLQKIYTS